MGPPNGEVPFLEFFGLEFDEQKGTRGAQLQAREEETARRNATEGINAEGRVSREQANEPRTIALQHAAALARWHFEFHRQKRFHKVSRTLARRRCAAATAAATAAAAVHNNERKAVVNCLCELASPGCIFPIIISHDIREESDNTHKCLVENIPVPISLFRLQIRVHGDVLVLGHRATRARARAARKAVARGRPAARRQCKFVRLRAGA